jgi:D-alanyl-D-alanine carboxypeptidase
MHRADCQKSPFGFCGAFTNQFPLVQTFRIVQPSNYARTILIEALQSAGVKISAAPVAQNPIQLLPTKGSYKSNTMVAKLIGLPYSEDAKLVLKISYNIGANISLLLYGLTQGEDNLKAALAAEQTNLAANHGIAKNQYVFVGGSGGGSTTSTSPAVTQFLIDMISRATFPVFFDALPILGVDGSLGFVTDFKSDPTLAGAAGQVHAKPGTFLEGSSSGLMLKGQAFGGYINTRSGKKLVYQLVVNNVPVTSLNDVIQVFQDEGIVSSMLWRDNTDPTLVRAAYLGKIRGSYQEGFPALGALTLGHIKKQNISGVAGIRVVVECQQRGLHRLARRRSGLRQRHANGHQLPSSWTCYR